MPALARVPRLAPDSPVRPHPRPPRPKAAHPRHPHAHRRGRGGLWSPPPPPHDHRPPWQRRRGRRGAARRRPPGWAGGVPVGGGLRWPPAGGGRPGGVQHVPPTPPPAVRVDVGGGVGGNATDAAVDGVPVDDNPPCRWTLLGAPLRQVLQINGSAEDVVQLLLCPPVHPNVTSVVNYTMSATSSAPDVLDVGRGDLDLTRTTAPAGPGVASTGCHNVSVVASFDRFVGVTDLTLTARAPPLTNTTPPGSVCDVTVSFRIVGVTVYEPASDLQWNVTKPPPPPSVEWNVTKPPPPPTLEWNVSKAPPVPTLEFDVQPRGAQPSGRRILSGVNADDMISVPYSSFQEASVHSYAVRVELPSDAPLLPARGFGRAGRRLAAAAPEAAMPSLDDIGMSVYPAGNVVVPYSAAACVNATAGGGGASDTPLPPRCGTALTGASRLVSGDRSATFAFRTALYRVGDAGVHLRWDALTDGWEAAFGGELYENFVPLTVRGVPPPVVTAMDAPAALRRQGGERVTLSLRNMGATVASRLFVDGVASPFALVPDSLVRVNGTGAGVDGSGGGVNGSGPSVVGSGPGVDGSGPGVVNGSGPGVVNGSGPGVVNGSGPGVVNGSGPGVVNGSGPGVDGTGPGVN
ncbi:hypothetical protein BU14_2114s0001, partial [Porphyra umbilicalis]